MPMTMKPELTVSMSTETIGVREASRSFGESQ